MSNCLGLIFNRCMLLSISWRHHAFSVGHISLSANFKELFRHIKIKFLSGYLVKFNQSQFHFLMTGSLADGFAVVIFWVSLKKHLIYMLGIFFSNFQQLVLASGKVVGNGSFVKVAHIVEFMAVHHKGIRSVAHHVFVSPNFGCMGRIKVSVGLLCGCNDIHNLIKLSFKFWIIL